jgi:hypothetical protein
MFTQTTTTAAPKFICLKDTIVSVDNVQGVSYDNNPLSKIYTITFKYHSGGMTKIVFYQIENFDTAWDLVLQTFGFSDEK